MHFHRNFPIREIPKRGKECAIMQSNQTEAEQTVTSAVRSMTGYGRAQQLIGNKEITVEIRSVNHRFLEYSSRVPRAYSYLEDRLKNLVKASVSRGKVDVSLSIQTVSGTDSQVVINHDLARSYLEALKSLAEDLQIKNDITVSQMTRFSDIFTVLRVADDEEEMWSAVEQVAQEAINNFVAMRLVEGKKMEQDLLYRLDLIEQMVKKVEELSPKTVENYSKRLHAKLQVFLFDGTIRENFDLFYDMREEKQPLDEDVQRFLSICCADFPLSANCATLSGGERQRVFLAIFLSAMPKVLLLDEQTAALDEQTSETLLHNLKQFCSQNNISVVCVCHNGELVRRFADQEIRLGEER